MISSRRCFIKQAGLSSLGLLVLPEILMNHRSPFLPETGYISPVKKYRPTLQAAFIRRKGEYGMRWPGQIYDGEAAFDMYYKQIEKAGISLGMDISIKKEPIYSLEEGERWISDAREKNTDGLLLVALDRQEHTWPSIGKAIDTGIPSVVFSPLGSSFTTNTIGQAHKKGAFICSTDDFSQAAFGLKMIKAGTLIRETRFLVIMDREREDTEIPPFGMKLRYLPANEYLSTYQDTETSDGIDEIVSYYMQHATHVHGATRDDVVKGVRAYKTALKLLEKEEADAITMDCLGVLGPRGESLPCLAWSRLNDSGIPAACEADLGACTTHALVQYLFDKPGFQQDPVAETSKQCLIGSHCSCPTMLEGFGSSPEPFDIMHHHGLRDATLKPTWKIGQRVSLADVILGEANIVRGSNQVKEASRMFISAGEVVDNKSIPPSGGCVVAPMIRLDGVDELLDYPGFHQIFFYGDHKRELKYFCRMWGIEPVVI